MRKNRRESNLKTAQVTFTFTKCKNTTSIASKWQHIRIANAPIPISSDRYIQRFERASFTFRFLLIAKESRIACHDYFSLRIDTARGEDHDSSHPTKRLFRVAPLLVCTTHHRNKLRFIPREFPRNILFPTPLEQPRDALYVTR